MLSSAVEKIKGKYMRSIIALSQSLATAIISIFGLAANPGTAVDPI
jgi:hypothetical protein